MSPRGARSRIARVMYITESGVVQLKTMLARLLRPILTLARYGRVMGQRANSTIHTSVIVHGFPPKTGRRAQKVAGFFAPSVETFLGSFLFDSTDWLQTAS